MADQDRTDDQDVSEQQIFEGGIENVVQEVESGEVPEGEHPDQVYQGRQRIVSPDSPADVLATDQPPAPDDSPEPLPPAETS